MVPATISSVVMISVARIYVMRMCVARIYVVLIYVVRVYVVTSVVMVSVARIYVTRMCVARIYVARMCVARIYVAWIYVAHVYADVCRFSSVVVVSVAREFCRCSLVDRRFEIEVMAQPRRHSRRRERRARGWCVDTARCCEVRGVASLKELRQSRVHLLDAALLDVLARAAVPHYVAHGRIGLFGGQLYLPQALGEVLKLTFPPLYDHVQVVGRYHIGSGIFHTWTVLSEHHLFFLGILFSPRVVECFHLAHLYL